MMKAPKAQVDPALAEEQRRSEEARARTLQESVSRETEELMRQFGARSALSGGTMKAPVLGY